METTTIQDKILKLRGHKVMLDYDLAALYEVETRVFNQSVKRNLDNFPDDFMFRLTPEEWKENNSSQFVMSSEKHRGKSYLPYAFTEHGVAMLASVLKSPKARKMNIAIVRVFISLRKSAVKYDTIKKDLDDLRLRLGEHDVQLSHIYDSLENLLEEKIEKKGPEERKRIGFMPDQLV